MRTLLLIVQREVRERVQTKSFRLFTAGLFALVFGAIVAIDRAPEIFGEDSFELGLSPATTPELQAAIQQSAVSEDVEVELVTVATDAEARTLLDDGDIDAFLSEGALTYAAGEDTALTNIVTQALFIEGLGERLDGLGLTEQEQRDLLAPPPVNVVLHDPDAADSDERQFIGFLAALALYLTLALYGNWILTGVVEEKSTRVVEVLLGIVRAGELLAGKTLGILVMAVSQLGVALLGGLAGLVVVGTSSLPPVALDVVLATVPLFVMGLLLYSLLFAAAGATVSRQADAQSAATPITVLLLTPYMFAAVFVPQNPDGIAAVFLSIFPLTSPLVMPARVATGDPTILELIACYGLLPPAILLVAWLGGRIYSGVILSGSRADLRSLVGVVLRPGQAP
jgi:ABC-2 type transport system permease protein